MRQIFYIVGFVVLLLLANHFMKKVKDEPDSESEKPIEQPDDEISEVEEELNEKEK